SHIVDRYREYRCVGPDFPRGPLPATPVHGRRRACNSVSVAVGFLILVIGATGIVGGQVLKQLTAAGVRVRALVRNPDAAGLTGEVEVVRGDLTLPETLDRCLDAVDTVFLVWVAPPATVAPVLERIAKRARRIVF